jgi:hypothetical protein
MPPPVFPDTYLANCLIVTVCDVLPLLLISVIFSCETGPLNLMIPMTACAGILTYVWPLVHGKGPLSTIAVLYGCAQTFAHITARAFPD